MDNYDFYSLVETRYILELNAAKLCALRRSDHNLLELELAAKNFAEKIQNGIFSAVEEDLAFHRAIAEGSKNMVLKSLLLTIMPDIMINYTKFKMCSSNAKVSKAVIEHEQLLEAIRKQDSTKAEKIMKEHLREIMNYAKTQNVI